MSKFSSQCYIVINPQHLKNPWSHVVYNPLSEALMTVGFKCTNLTEEELLNCYEKIGDDDLVLFAGSFLLNLTSAEALSILSCMSGTKVSMCFDDEYLYRRSIKQSKYMHHHITFDSVTFEYLLQLGLSCSLCPLPLSPVTEINHKHKNISYDVSFVGRVNADKPLRYDLLKKIQIRYPNSFIPGLQGEFIGFDHMYNVFSQSKININLSAISGFSLDDSLPYQHYRHGFKARPFEIGMCGGFCLSEFSRSTELIMRDNDCLPSFAGVDQCIRQIDYFLEDQKAREKIAKRLNLFTIRYINSKSTENCFANVVKNIYLYNIKNKENMRSIPASYLIDDKPALILSMEKERLMNFLKRKSYKRFFLQLIFMFKIEKLSTFRILGQTFATGTSWIIRKFFLRK